MKKFIKNLKSYQIMYSTALTLIADLKFKIDWQRRKQKKNQKCIFFIEVIKCIYLCKFMIFFHNIIHHLRNMRRN